ncbi:hypothetical protein GCG54_00010383 [Colletotrichum gloeosporioides]|uniref:Uncharacterized protein n=1 Tax=Colletotrichum gloeosporioides TaxID=474922 RepID=A0A8H4CWF3_COLGL|nr:uncharacterized protein GCG54_00010383 [Colletotrichum gloeosporioides]KAF3811047.1 hypothetical protein GCG54_00010383 [Colletotrichum gloeosporioides]
MANISERLNISGPIPTEPSSQNNAREITDVQSLPAREYAVEESVGTTIHFDDNTAVEKRDSELETRGLTPNARFSANFYPKFHTAARPFAQAITIAGHAYIMQAWVDLQNRINIMVDAAFPGVPAPTAGVSNKHAAFAVLPHLWTLGTTYFAQDTGGEFEPGDAWAFFWYP